MEEKKEHLSSDGDWQQVLQCSPDGCIYGPDGWVLFRAKDGTYTLQSDFLSHPDDPPPDGISSDWIELDNLALENIPAALATCSVSSMGWSMEEKKPEGNDLEKMARIERLQYEAWKQELAQLEGEDFLPEYMCHTVNWPSNWHRTKDLEQKIRDYELAHPEIRARKCDIPDCHEEATTLLTTWRGSEQICQERMCSGHAQNILTTASSTGQRFTTNPIVEDEMSHSSQ